MISICLATADGLSMVSEAGSAWQGETKLRGKDVRCVVCDVDRRGAILCGTHGDGLWKSSDRGATWNRCRSFPGSKVSALAKSSSGFLYAGTEMSALFRSNDAGESWQELQTLLTLPAASSWSFPPHPETHHVQSVLSSLVQPSRLHVAIEAGALLRSDDAGMTWQDRVSGSPKDTHSLTAHPSGSARLHAAAGDGYFESHDDGDSWERRVEGLKHQYCWSIAISADTTTLLMSTARDAYAAHFTTRASSFVYRRTGNEPWQAIFDGLPESKGTRVPVVASSGVEPGIFYCAAEGQVYRSSDDGLRWSKIRIEWNTSSSMGHPVAVALFKRADEPSLP